MAEEKLFENKVKHFLSVRGCWYVKYWGGGQFTKAGVPDLLTCIGGRFVGIELKATHGTPSDLQLINLKKIERAGGIGLLLYPQDWAEFVHLVGKLQSARQDGTLLSPDGYTIIGRWHELLKERGIT